MVIPLALFLEQEQNSFLSVCDTLNYLLFPIFPVEKRKLT
jgi:hypothetical protein